MKCPNCQYDPTMSEIQRSPDDCVKCGINYDDFLKLQASRAEQKAEAIAIKELDVPRPVVVIDIDMKFWSMVKFMVKWAIAAIPAIIILVVIVTAAVSFFAGAIGSYISYSKMADNRVELDKNDRYKLDPPERIFFPASSEGAYWLRYLKKEGSFYEAIFYVTSPGGSKFGSLLVDCQNAMSTSLRFSDRIDGFDKNYDKSMTQLYSGTERYFIAYGACRNSFPRHQSLQ